MKPFPFPHEGSDPPRSTENLPAATFVLAGHTQATVSHSPGVLSGKARLLPAAENPLRPPHPRLCFARGQPAGGESQHHERGR